MPVEPGLRAYGWDSAKSTPDHEYTFPAIVKMLPAGAGNILDAGCGNGAIAGSLAEMGYQVKEIDLSEDGIIIASKAQPKVRFEVASVYGDLHTITDKVDVVISSEVIEHFYQPQRYLQNMALSLFNYWDKHNTVDWEGGHIKFFSQKMLSKMLLTAGFSEITFNNAGRLPWLWKSMVCRARKTHD